MSNIPCDVVVVVFHVFCMQLSLQIDEASSPVPLLSVNKLRSWFCLNNKYIYAMVINFGMLPFAARKLRQYVMSERERQRE